MKRSQKLAVVLSLILALCSWTRPLAQTATTIRIGVVDQDKVLNDSEEGKRLKDQLQKLRESKASQIGSLEQEMKSLQDKLMNAQLSLSSDKRKEISRQLKRKRVEYERLNDDASAEFQDAATSAQARLIKIFREIILKYGTEKGYTVIFEANTLYYSAPTVDVTADLLTRFNAYGKTTAGQ